MEKGTMRKKKITVLGSTGSIGCQTLAVVREFADKFEVVGLAAGSDLAKLARQVAQFRPRTVSIGNPAEVQRFKQMIPDGIHVTAGLEGLQEVAAAPEADVVVSAISGTLGLLPAIEAIKAGKDIALANKETLVAAGELVMSLAGEKGVRILPVDSEHSAIFQCLNGENPAGIRRILLTASGGPFLGKTREELARVTVAETLKHPNWSMGRKITVDSATLMNKGLEVIEARWLFDLDFDRIEVLVHPESIVHSMVEFVDGSVMAQMGVPDMRIPIQYALTYPERWSNNFPKLNLLEVGQLTFVTPRTDVFPCLELAFAAGRRGGTAPAVLNAANEAAVALFLDGRINFTDIAVLVEKVLAVHDYRPRPGLAEILGADNWAREETLRLSDHSRSSGRRVLRI